MVLCGQPGLKTQNTVPPVNRHIGISQYPSTLPVSRLKSVKRPRSRQWRCHLRLPVREQKLLLETASAAALLVRMLADKWAPEGQREEFVRDAAKTVIDSVTLYGQFQKGPNEDNA